ncbi:hypothetical protein TNCV_245581 [Trichonephila clavipes]|nr:hypothetical protein TNCV_245581 [Trichonephila clavipes]
MIVDPWPTCYEFELVQLKTYHVERLIHVKSIKDQCPPVGILRKFEEGMPTQVSSSSLDHGSKLRGPSPIALVLLPSAALVCTHARK